MNVNPQEIIATVTKRSRWLIASVAVFTLLSIAYALLKPNVYDARQPLIVRDEGYGSMTRLGEFSSVDAMQTAQETIMEVARHPSVLRAALAEVGPAKRKSAKKGWPSAKTVHEFGTQVEVSAPGGAQFGRTEMIYLIVKADSPQRAVALNRAACDHLIQRMQQLRKKKYTSIIDELTSTTKLARQEMATTSDQLKTFETEMGSNLAELRMAMDSAQGQSHLREALTAVTNDLRGVRASQIRMRNDIEQLRKAAASPALLISMPNQVLDAQPTLKKLKESLVEVQVTTARLAGEMSPTHPKLKAAIESEQRLKHQLVNELRVAMKALEVAQKTSEQRVAALEKQRAQLNEKLARLSSQRTQYANLLAELDQRNAFLEQAERDLGNARANLLSSAQVSLIQRVDTPIPSIDPLGPGKTTIVLSGVLGGLITGLGLIYIVGGEASRKRRITDQIRYGRRCGDANRTPNGRFVDRRASQPGRRQVDLSPPPPASPPQPGADVKPSSAVAKKHPQTPGSAGAAKKGESHAGSLPVIPAIEGTPESGAHLHN